MRVVTRSCLILLLSIIAPAATTAQAPRPPAPGVAGGRIHGRVRDSAGQPVVGARVALSGTSRVTYSARDGGFNFLSLDAGRYVLRAQRLGYAPSSPDTFLLAADETVERDVRLREVTVPLAQVVITPGSFSLLDQQATSQQILTRAALLARPQLVEDLFRSLNRLPGLSGSDYGAKVRIRNGGADEQLVSLDGLELIEPFHLKDFDGALSILDGDAIGKVSITTGGFGVPYGNRMTGIIQLQSADPTTARSRSAVGLSLSNVRARTEGSFDGGRGSWFVSARRGYLDIVFKLVGEENPPDPKYYDVFAKVQHQLGSHHVGTLYSLVANDRLTLTGDDEVSKLVSSYGNGYVWGTLRSQVAERVLATTLVSYSSLAWTRNGNDFDIFRRQAYERTRIDDHRRLHAVAIKQDWTVELSPRANVFVGGEARNESADYQYRRAQWDRAFVDSSVAIVDSRLIDVSLSPSGARWSGYGAVRLRPMSKLTTEVGLRADRHGWTDETTVAPRVNVALSPWPSTTIRMAWGMFDQAQGLQDLSIVDGDTAFARAERAEHRVIGVEHEFGSGWNGRAEVYERRLSRPRARYYNTDGSLDALPEALADRLRFAPSSGRVRGLELLAQFDGGGRVRGGGSYVLSKATAVVSGLETARPFDERHAIALDIAVQPQRGWTWAFAWTYHSGWPHVPATFVVDTLGPERLSARRVASPAVFGERLTGYQRLDVRVSRAFTSRRGRVNLFADIFNVFDRSNQRGYEYFGFVDRGRLTVGRDREEFLGRLPTIGVSWEF